MAIWIYTHSELSLIFAFIDIADYFDPFLFIPGIGMLPLPNIVFMASNCGPILFQSTRGQQYYIKINLFPALDNTGTSKMSPGFSYYSSSPTELVILFNHNSDCQGQHHITDFKIFLIHPLLY